jgi:hypothetical protein
MQKPVKQESEIQLKKKQKISSLTKINKNQTSSKSNSEQSEDSRVCSVVEYLPSMGEAWVPSPPLTE